MTSIMVQTVMSYKYV